MGWGSGEISKLLPFPQKANVILAVLLWRRKIIQFQGWHKYYTHHSLPHISGRKFCDSMPSPLTQTRRGFLMYLASSYFEVVIYTSKKNQRQLPMLKQWDQIIKNKNRTNSNERTRNPYRSSLTRGEVAGYPGRTWAPASKEALVKPWGLRPRHANEHFPSALSSSSVTGWLFSLLKCNCTYRKVDRTELLNTL